MTLWLTLSLAYAGEGSLGALVGFRTNPEAGLEQSSEWEPELEPAAAGAVIGRWRAATSSGAWVGVEGEAWGLVPEGEASLLALGPRAGVGLPLGASRLEVAARYDARAYLVEGTASSGRAEGLVSLRGPAGAAVTPELSVLAVDRFYPNTPSWSFRTAEAQGGGELWHGIGRVRLLAGGQVNGSQGVSGTQVRGQVEVGLAPRGWETWVGYGLIVADGGEVQAATRPVFTPVGEYSADADALSAGGFVQHRLEVGFAARLSAWTVRASALGRVRASAEEDLGAFVRAGHGQLDVERTLTERLSGSATVGVSAASLERQRGFLDAYGWVGMTWAFGGPTAQPRP